MNWTKGYSTRRFALAVIVGMVIWYLIFGVAGVVLGFILDVIIYLQIRKKNKEGSFHHNSQADIDRKNMAILKKISIMLLVLFVIIGVLYAYGSSLNAGKIGSAQSPSAENVQAQPIQSPDKITNATIDELFYKFVSKLSDLTDLQKKEEWKSYDGKYINGSVIVSDIKNEPLVGYVVSAENPENHFESEATIYFKNSEKSKLMQLQKGDTISFYGRLNDYNSILGITVKDAEMMQ